VIFSSLAGRDVELAAGQDVAPVTTPSAQGTQTTAEVTATATPTATPMAATPTPVLPTPTAVISATPTAAPSPTATKKEEQPPLLTRLLQKYGYAIDDINADQLMLLAYDNGVSKLYLYDKDSDAGLWRLAYSFDAHVGKNGITDNKTEGDKKTPTGYYALGFAFGNEAKPDTQWTYRDVTPNSYWVDDPDSASYNTWVEDTGDRDWNSAEHLSDVPIQYARAGHRIQHGPHRARQGLRDLSALRHRLHSGLHRDCP
jgi:hypothetical protein